MRVHCCPYSSCLEEAYCSHASYVLNVTTTRDAFSSPFCAATFTRRRNRSDRKPNPAVLPIYAAPKEGNSNADI
jgi:hypothetical protein